MERLIKRGIKEAGCYGIFCSVTSVPTYFGSAVNLHNRKMRHFWELRNNKHHNRRLQNAYNKYGEDAFSFIPLFHCHKHELIQCEENLLFLVFDISSNICRKAASRFGCKNSKDHNEKISKAHKGRKGKPHTEEFKALMSAKMKGRVSPWKGRKASDETKKKMSEAHKGIKVKPFSDEARKRMSEAHLGNKMSEETKEKMKIARNQRKVIGSKI